MEIRNIAISHQILCINEIDFQNKSIYVNNHNKKN